jgi:para-aminobenzoate synthetase component I
MLGILPSLDRQARNVVLLGGTGGGWRPCLAYNPCDSLNFDSSSGTTTEIADFIEHNKGKLIVGFISYAFGCRLQGISNKKRDDPSEPGVHFLAYDNFLLETDGQIKSYGQPALMSSSRHKSEEALLSQNFRETISKNEYSKLFDKTIEYIKAGHIYQLNLSHRLTARSSQNPRILFSKLAKDNLAPMMGYFESDNFELLSISPERFVQINGGIIKTTPIKGTRAISGTAAKEKLLNDPKEKSELSMITDLLRNDLSKVSDAGSVKVTTQRATHTLTSIIHTYSEISAKLRKNIAPIEALISMFPGGSITGCPKRRAMQIINELEIFPRGAYCGSLVCVSPNGNLDSSILIRTIIKKGQELVLPVGGGIVFDSKKDEEYQETMDKAESIIKVLRS